MLARFRESNPDDDRPDDPVWVNSCAVQYAAMGYAKIQTRDHLQKLAWDWARESKLTPAKPHVDFFVHAGPDDHLVLTYNSAQLAIDRGKWINAASIGMLLTKCDWKDVVAVCDFNQSLKTYLCAAHALSARVSPVRATREAEGVAADLFFTEACRLLEVDETDRERRVRTERDRRAFNAKLAAFRFRRRVTRIT